jgi:DNA-binding NarL/FixJ family response regulator
VNKQSARVGGNDLYRLSFLVSACGWLPGRFSHQDKAPSQLITAIRSAARGEVLLTPAQRAQIRAWEEDVDARWQRLSARERDVLVLLAQGKTTAEIAAALLITENTVRTHVGNLLGKLEMDSRGAAIAWTWKHGFVEEEGDSEGP